MVNTKNLVNIIIANHIENINKLRSAIPDIDMNVKFVGGCVRNALTNQPIKDIDFATKYKPQQIKQYLHAAHLKTIDIGSEYGTIIAIINKQRYEITSLRQDIENYGRKAKVVFTNDWYQDSCRRDFTCNAIYLDFQNNIYDPHNGQNDLQNDILKFIGDPQERIQEDYLRLLRFCRFYAQFNNGQISDELLQILISNIKHLNKISTERIHYEIFCLLQVKDLLNVVNLLMKVPLLEEILKITPLYKDLLRLCMLEQKNAIPLCDLRRLFVLLPSNFALKLLNNYLKISQATYKQLLQLQKLRLDLSSDLRSILYFNGQQNAHSWLLFNCLYNDQVITLAQLQYVKNWVPKKFFITGNDLLQQGFKPNRTLGQQLKILEKLWINSDFSLTFKQLICKIPDNIIQ